MRQGTAELSDAPTRSNGSASTDHTRVPAEVRVATIRPTTRLAAGDEPAAPNWQHRWIVRMHKVRQWYPSEQRHKVIYRGPYVKGPADKPFIRGETARGMTR